jgi:hypothetical protein
VRRPAVVVPLAPVRYKVQAAVGADACATLRRAPEAITPPSTVNDNGDCLAVKLRPGKEFRSERGVAGVGCDRSKVAKSEMSRHMLKDTFLSV